MFILKKIAGQLLLPMPFLGILCCIGLVLLWTRRKKGGAQLLVTISVLGMLAVSTGPVADWFIAPLENRYPPILPAPAAERPDDTATDAAVDAQAGDMAPADGSSTAKSAGAAPDSPLRDIEYIVILGGGLCAAADYPLASQLDCSSLHRFLQGLHLYQQHQDCRLILSGGQKYTLTGSTAQVMADLAQAMGVPRSKMIINSLAYDTKDEARRICGIVESSPFALITSAAHMPRAVAMFRKLGCSPVPVPADHRVMPCQNDSLRLDFLPRADNLLKSEAAIHEYIGLAWSYLMNQI